MKRKITYILICVLSLLFLYNSINYILNRIDVMIETQKFTCFYNVVNVDAKYENIVITIEKWFKNIWNELKTFFIWLYQILISPDALIFYTWCIQIYVYIYVFFKIWTSGKNLSFKVSKPAKVLIFIVENIRRFIIYMKEFYIENKKIINRIIIWCSGIGLIITFELILFMFQYMYSVALFETHLMLFQVFKYIVVNVVDFFMFEHPALIILFLLTFYTVIAINMGKRKLLKNWIELKWFTDSLDAMSILSGAPGTGKTSSGFNMMYAQNELYLDAYVDSLLDFEINNPQINFSYIRLIGKVIYDKLADEEVERVLKDSKYILVDVVRAMQYLNNEVLENMFRMYYRGSAILSVSPLRDPYTKNQDTKGFSRAFDVDTMRLYKKGINLPLEDDTCLFYDEFDKEFNSHTSQGEVNKDGVHVFFSYIRHLGAKAILTCQGIGQGLKNIKVCAGQFIWLYDKKVKMPFLVSLLYKPIYKLDKVLKTNITEYLGTRECTGKWTNRRGAFVYKRNNVSFIYQLMKYLALGTNTLVNYFQNFYYYKIYGELSFDADGTNKQQIKYKINFCDFNDDGMPVYNTRQFKSFYDEFKYELSKKNGLLQDLELFEAWKSLDPTVEEYAKTHQSVIQKIYDTHFKDEE